MQVKFEHKLDEFNRFQMTNIPILHSQDDVSKQSLVFVRLKLTLVC